MQQQLMITQRLLRYSVLMRLNKPIGILLLLWPTLWALWLAKQGVPDWHLLWIFVVGVIIMRSAGCIINDIADRHIDAHVKRTAQRPLACHVLSVKEAIILFAILMGMGFLLLLQLNQVAILCGLIASAFIVFYPFSKRYTYFPQAVLAVTFYASVPIAFVATMGHFTSLAWWTYATAALWIFIYDTMYAMADRQDDLHVGIKSTAIFFGPHDRVILASLQCVFIVFLYYLGRLAHLTAPYYIAVGIAALLCLYHQYLIRHRRSHSCFHAFLHNNWIGLVIFVGIVISYCR